jgi:hypothetical protein
MSFIIIIIIIIIIVIGVILSPLATVATTGLNGHMCDIVFHALKAILFIHAQNLSVPPQPYVHQISRKLHSHVLHLLVYVTTM